MNTLKGSSFEGYSSRPLHLFAYTRMLGDEVDFLSVCSIRSLDLSILLCKFLISEDLLEWSKSWRLLLTPSAHIVAVWMENSLGPSTLSSCADEAWRHPIGGIPGSSGFHPIAKGLKVRMRILTTHTT